MTRAQIIKYGVIALASIAGIVLLVTVFKPKQATDNKYFDLLLQEKDKSIQREREYRVEIIKMYDEVIADSRRKDSLLAIKSKVNTIRYEAVSPTVDAIPDNDLQRSILQRYNDLLAQ